MRVRCLAPAVALSLALVVAAPLAAGATATSAPSAPGSPTGYVLSVIATGYTSSVPLAVATGPGGQIVVADATTGDVTTMTASGTDPETIATGLVSAAPLAVAVNSAGEVFVADGTSGDVISLAADGADETTIATGLTSATGLELTVVGTSHLYVFSGSTGAVYSMTQSGNGETTVMSGLSTTQGAALAASGSQAYLLLGSGSLGTVSNAGFDVIGPVDGATAVTHPALAFDGTGQFFYASSVVGDVSELDDDLTAARTVLTPVGTTESVALAATSSSGLVVADGSSGDIDLATPNPLATPAEGAVTVDWAAPTNDGGLALNDYVVIATPAVGTPIISVYPGTSTQATVWGLSPSEAYEFTIEAVNADGASPPSATSNWVTPDVEVPYVMDPPTVVAEPGGLDLTWVAPNDGGSALLGYDATATPVGGGTSVMTTFSPVATAGEIVGLTNGVAYKVTMSAVNANGQNAASIPSASATPATVPEPPTTVTAAAGNARASVSWVASASDGGSPITAYTVTAYPGHQSCTTRSLTCVVTKLSNSLSYVFSVTAANAIGASAASVPSAPVVPALAPSSPTGVSARAAVDSATVSWKVPSSDGGAPIVGYVVTASPGGLGCTTTTTSCTVTGLSAAKSYRFSVVARNDAARSLASAPSAAVKPLA